MRILLTACVSTALSVVLHALASRLSGHHSVRQLGGVIICGLTITMVGSAWLQPESVLDLPAVAALTLCFCLAYVHWYVAMFRSLSVRILEELLATNGTLTREELERVYPLRWMFTSRIQTLQENGWIVRTNDMVQCTTKGSSSARVIQRFRRLYGIRRAG